MGVLLPPPILICADVLIPGAEAITEARFGEGTGRILLSGVQCTGIERALTDCITNPSAINSCTHAQDAGVRCQQGTEVVK